MLNTVLEHHLPIAQAAEIMGVSERHTKRLMAAYRREGAAALAHGNRGRRPHNAVPEAAAAAVVKLTTHHSRAPTTATSPNCCRNGKGSN